MTIKEYDNFIKQMNELRRELVSIIEMYQELTGEYVDPDDVCLLDMIDELKTKFKKIA
jgi:division protein CdvB (Snf7/Vps24/ESCRT-III family)